MAERLEAAAAAEEPVILRRTAHSLKSSSAIIGARGLSEIARQLEDAGRAGEIARAPELLRSLRAELARTYRELETITQDLRAESGGTLE